MVNMFACFEKELKFDKRLAQQNLQTYLSRQSFKENMKGSDWRLYFVLYSQTLLPCIKQDSAKAQLIMETWIEIQYLCYFTLQRKFKSKQVVLRFWVTTFLHGLYCIERWGKEIMGLYLHNIWIHWAEDFHHIDFAQESTDNHEAWLATVKRILRYLTCRRKDEALDELIIRLFMEEPKIDNSKTENKISKAFATYPWKEYCVEITQSQKSEWSAFINTIQKVGFTEKTKDFKVYKDSHGKLFIRFFTEFEK